VGGRCHGQCRNDPLSIIYIEPSEAEYHINSAGCNADLDLLSRPIERKLNK